MRSVSRFFEPAGFVIAMLIAFLFVLTVLFFTPSARADEPCYQTVEQARVNFEDENKGTFEVFSVANPYALEAVALYTGARPEVAQQIYDKGKFVAIGTAPGYPPGIVTVGVFDERLCIVNSRGNVYREWLDKAIGPPLVLKGGSL